MGYDEDTDKFQELISREIDKHLWKMIITGYINVNNGKLSLNKEILKNGD